MRTDCSVLFDSKTVIRKEFVNLPLAMSPPTVDSEVSSKLADVKFSSFASLSATPSPGGVSTASSQDSTRVDSIWSNRGVGIGGNNSMYSRGGSTSSSTASLEEEHFQKEDIPEYSHSLIRRLQAELHQSRQRTEYLEKRNRSLEDQLLEMNEKYLNLEKRLLAVTQDQSASFGNADGGFKSSSYSNGPRHSHSHHRSSYPAEADSGSLSSQDPEQAAVRAIIETYSNRGICRHYIQGRCRYKAQCKFSHEVDQCPFCQESLPRSKIASSTHLARCFKMVTQSDYSSNN
jgi:hypothetical protein